MIWCMFFSIIGSDVGNVIYACLTPVLIYCSLQSAYYIIIKYCSSATAIGLHAKIPVLVDYNMQNLIKFKMLMLMHRPKCSCGHASVYIRELSVSMSLISGRRHLRLLCSCLCHNIKYSQNRVSQGWNNVFPRRPCFEKVSPVKLNLL